ncbi:MAG: sodium:solute symporter [Erysipelotrichaceae bacterium]|nr:sodium:solute symporter [Erysipelotrichaceae bacterium]
MLISLCLIVCFFALMIGIGIYSRKNAQDVNGFVLGDRKAGPWLSAFAFGTSYFSAVIFVGYAGQFGWNFGLASTWIGLGNAFIGSLMAWSILGRRTRIMTQHLSSMTMPDFFGTRFRDRKLTIAASVITFVFLIPYTASLYNGLSRLFAMAFGGIDYSVCVIVMAVLTGLYVIIGGYMATAINDFIQGMIMLFGIVLVICAVLNANGGLMEATRSLAGITGEAGWQGAYTSFLGPDPAALLFVVLLTSLGTWGLPQMVGKFYAIKNEDAIKKGTVISTVFALVVAGGCYFLGGFGRLYAVDVVREGFDAIIPNMLSTLPPIIIGIVIVLVLSASMSTLSSLVLTSGSTITLDFIALLSKKKMSEKTKMTVMRFFIVVFIAISAVIAIYQASSKSIFIAQMMGISWGAMAGAFLAPFLYGLYFRKTSRAAVVVSFIFGVGLEVIQLFVSLGLISFAGIPVLEFMFTNSLYSGVFAMVGGLILVPLISVLTPETCPDTDDIFSCYEDNKVVGITDSLGD